MTAVLCAFWCVPAEAYTPLSADSPAITSVPAITPAPAILVTGYTCPPFCAPTADGKPIGPGLAACPPSWPFGTAVDIDGVGIVTCDDSYDPSLSDRIDVFEASEDDCYLITGLHEYFAVFGDGSNVPPTAA